MQRDARKPPTSGEALLRTLFQPEAIAVIGASDDPVKLSGRPVRYLRSLGYRGEVYPVNPRRSRVQGLPAYRTVHDLPRPADLAIVAVPAAGAPAAVAACADAGVRVAIVYASGFGETGPEGLALQQEIAAIARRSGLRVLGPNCLGAIGVRSRVTATFSSAFDQQVELSPGGVALVSQSGAFGTFVFAAASDAGVRFSHFANTGNEADLTVCELGLALLEDDEVRVLLTYQEGAPDGDDLLRLGRRARELDKPVVTVKVGRSADGARAAASHTGAVAGADEAYDALVRRAGILRVDGMAELIDAARVFGDGRRPSGQRLAVLTVSGGAGALVADLAETAGLRVPEWEGDWRQRMAAEVPQFGSARNPVDVTATVISRPEILRAPLRIALDHPGTDLVCVLLGNAAAAEEPLLAALLDAHAATDKPLAVVWTGGSGRAVRRLTEAGVPAFEDPGRAVRALSLLGRWAGSDHREDNNAMSHRRASGQPG